MLFKVCNKEIKRDVIRLINGSIDYINCIGNVLPIFLVCILNQLLVIEETFMRLTNFSERQPNKSYLLILVYLRDCLPTFPCIAV